GWKEQMAWGAYGLGWVAFSQRDYPAARARFEEALRLCHEVGNQIFAGFYLDGLATVVLAQGQATWAAQLWGVAERGRSMNFIPVPPVLRRINERLVKKLQAHLGEETLTALLSKEDGLTLDEVLQRGEPAKIRL